VIYDLQHTLDEIIYMSVKCDCLYEILEIYLEYSWTPSTCM